jgi:1-aminocyclopropane-1-carboxylate deaminase
MAITDFPRYPLTFGPSPIHPLKRLTAHLGGASVWAKREDCNSGLAYGGNKVRKLEYLVPEALAQGADTLVSIGGYQSNHTRQVAAVAAHLGMRCVLVQEKWVDWPDSVNDRVGNIMLSRIMGAEVRLDPAGFDIGFRDSWKQAIADVEARGGTPYAIPAGASDHQLGGLGFAHWAYEVAQQEEQLGVFFDTILVCTVTGSTHAGMIAGFAALEAAGGRPRRVIGIDASATLEQTRDQVSRIARRTADLIGLGRDLREDEITVMEGWAGDLYGIPVRSTLDAIRLTGQLEGVILDPVYEGKSMAGLIDLVRDGEIPADSNVLYAHLGGQPALNAYSALFPVTQRVEG